ncbi:MAG TPA: hypothetical protein VJP02_22840 [Candidatus Sulfotelmatobacter sp.]|nr:hypothetical protein [Candidatus Sulfotelmatobacter sp.]
MTQQTASNPLRSYRDGFVAVSRNIVDDLQSGKMTAQMFPVYFTVLQQANWSTGVWNGNAHRIYHALCGTYDLSDIKKQMAKLRRAGVLKSFHKQGRKGNYNVLIHGFSVTVGELRGRVLNALASTSWQHPVYESGTDMEQIGNCEAPDSLLTRSSSGTESRPYQEVQDSQDSKDSKKSSLPTIQDRANAPEGTEDGTLAPEPKRHADKVIGLLSDCLKEKGSRRSFPNNDQARALRTEIESNGEPDVILAFVQFLGRSKGVSNIIDPWKMFLEELPYHLSDVVRERSKIGDEYESAAEMAEELISSVFLTDATESLYARVRKAVHVAEPAESTETV